MLPELAIPLILALVDLVHDVAELAGEPGNPQHHEAILQDYMVQSWGGPIGWTPRSDPGLRQRELAALPWIQAIADSPMLRRRRRR